MKQLFAFKSTVALIALATLLGGCGDSSPPQKDELAPVAKQVAARINWIDSTHYWHPATDPLGSQIDTTGGLFRGGEAIVGFTITPKTTDVWPYVELIFLPEQSFVGSSQLELAYRSEKPLIVKLSQTDFGPDGNQTWSYYQTVVPPAQEWTTLLLPYSQFELPDWADDNSRAIPLKLENVKGVYLTPQLDAINGESCTMGVQKLLFY